MFNNLISLWWPARTHVHTTLSHFYALGYSGVCDSSFKAHSTVAKELLLEPPKSGCYLSAVTIEIHRSISLFKAACGYHTVACCCSNRWHITAHDNVLEKTVAPCSTSLWIQKKERGACHAACISDTWRAEDSSLTQNQDKRHLWSSQRDFPATGLIPLRLSYWMMQKLLAGK